MAIKDSCGGKSWIEWDKEIRIRKQEEINKYEEELKDDINFYKYQQYLFVILAEYFRQKIPIY